MQADELWNKTLPLLHLRMPGRYASTFQFCKGVEVVGDVLTLEVPGFYGSDKQTTDKPIIEESIYEASDGVRYQVRFKVTQAVGSVPPPSPPPPVAAPSSGAQAGGLLPKFTFDSFVIGAHNRFAHAAALAVSSKPGYAYNPLFIYGSKIGRAHV